MGAKAERGEVSIGLAPYDSYEEGDCEECPTIQPSAGAGGHPQYGRGRTAPCAYRTRTYRKIPGVIRAKN